MHVRVRLYALLRSREGASVVTMDLPEEATLADLVHEFFFSRPTLAALQPHIRIGVSGLLVARDANLSQIIVSGEKEYALLPLRAVVRSLGSSRESWHHHCATLTSPRLLPKWQRTKTARW